MRMNVDFATHIYEIEFEPFLGTNSKEYQENFEKWYYEEVTEYINGEKYIILKQRNDLKYDSFGIDVIFDWMKEFSPNSKPRIIKQFIGRKGYNSKLPSINF